MKKGIEQGIEKGLQQGWAKGALEGKKSVARNMLAKGIELSLVREVTGLTEDELAESSH